MTLGGVSGVVLLVVSLLCLALPPATATVFDVLQAHGINDCLDSEDKHECAVRALDGIVKCRAEHLEPSVELKLMLDDMQKHLEHTQTTMPKKKEKKKEQEEQGGVREVEYMQNHKEFQLLLNTVSRLHSFELNTHPFPSLAAAADKKKPARDGEEPWVHPVLRPDFPRGDVGAQRAAVVQEFKHAWGAYAEVGFGMDEFHPVSRTASLSYGMGLTIVDSLDTMLLMGLIEEYARAREWVANELEFSKDLDVNLFESTIRVLGGLLGAYTLTEDEMYVDKSRALADELLVAFGTKTGLPYGTVNFKYKNGSNPAWCGGASTVSEVGSIQLEWQYLSTLTGDPVYRAKVDAVMDVLWALDTDLYAQFIHPDDAELLGGKVCVCVVYVRSVSEVSV
jgi:hypothetical protein